MNNLLYYTYLIILLTLNATNFGSVFDSDTFPPVGFLQFREGGDCTSDHMQNKIQIFRDGWSVWHTRWSRMSPRATLWILHCYGQMYLYTTHILNFIFRCSFNFMDPSFKFIIIYFIQWYYFPWNNFEFKSTYYAFRDEKF